MASLSISETVGSVLAQYSLSEPKNIRLMEASNRNENFVILDANKNKYILRRYRRNDDRKRALFQLKLQQHLFDNNFPTSEIVKTTSNELIVIINETVWALFTFMEGKEYDFSRLEQAAEAGRRLAQFHNILSSFHEVQTYLDYNLPIRKAYIKYMSNLE